MKERFHSPPHPQPAAEAAWLGRWFAAARREGLLALLTPEAWHTLSALLSFTRRDGLREFTLDQLAVALGQSSETARARLEQLTRTEWKGEPLAAVEHNRAGEIIGATLAPIELLSGAKAPLPTAADTPLSAVPALPVDGAPEGLTEPLQAAGLNPDQIDWLLKHFSHDRICRQLDWLPGRQPRNPAALLIRAIEGDWGPPREAA